MNIGQRIKAARTAQGLSQEEIARRSGMSLKGMSYIERGHIEDPHISSVSRIADALGISLSELVEEEPVAAGKAEAPEEGAAGPARITKAKRKHIQSAAVDVDIMGLYRWADEAERQFETLDREDYELKDVRSFHTSFIDRLRNYQRYTYKPLRDQCEPDQLENLERVEKRLMDLRDKVLPLFQDRRIIKRLEDKLNRELDPKKRAELDELVQDLAQDREHQAAGIEEMSPTVGESAG